MELDPTKTPEEMASRRAARDLGAKTDSKPAGTSAVRSSDAQFDTGAVRSGDVDEYDFASAPLLGLLGVLKVAGRGGIKYGRLNYAKGMPVHVTLNHIAVHLIRYLLGDRTEDHLSKVAWGAMVANQTAILQPELAAPHLLGPGATLTAAALAEMARGAKERAAKRESGEFDDLCAWTLADTPEVQAILAQRQPAPSKRGSLLPPDWAPGSTNAHIYGAPTRVESEAGEPTPGPDEQWTVFDGQRVYFPKKS